MRAAAVMASTTPASFVLTLARPQRAACCWRCMRDIDIIDSELRLLAALRRAAQERGGPLPSIGVADALLDERSELTASNLPRLCAWCPQLALGHRSGMP
ncbi:MAG TPA: hypothetical protein VMQ38_01610 [Mycobacterium sp.]|nr:hypothetical protein [Mycobacterium sp.]